MAIITSPFGGSGRKPQMTDQQEENQKRIAEAQRKATEILELNKSVDTAIERVRNQPPQLLSPQEKQLVIAELERMAASGVRGGKKPRTGIMAKLGSLVNQAVGNIVAPFAPSVGPIGDIKERLGEALLQTGQRAIGSAVTEGSELYAKRGFDPSFVFRPAAFTPTTAPAGAKSMQELSGRVQAVSGATPMTEEQRKAVDYYTGISGQRLEPSLREMLERIGDTEFAYRDTPIGKAVQKANPWQALATDISISVAGDPTSYVTGIGNVKFVGRLGKLSLAQRLSTAEKVAKYPQLAGRFNDLVRFGQHAPIEGLKEILKAEGIETGVRVMGKTIKGTEEIAAPFGRALSTGWETIMDLVTRKFADVVDLSPSSRAFMRNVGRRSKGAYRVSDSKALGAIANWSAYQYANGIKGYALSRHIHELKDIIAEAKASGRDDLYDLVERANPYTTSGRVRFDALDEPTKAIVQRYVDWQRNSWTELNELRQQLARDYGLRTSQLPFIENYLTHRMTPEAFEWLRKNNETAKRLGYNGDDLTYGDFTQIAANARYRKYRAPETLPDGTVKTEMFFGQEVREGTIKELNDIFKKQTGTDINFFDTDLGSIGESYATALARSRGIVGYARRMLEYGPDVARPLLDNMVPDPALRAAAREKVDALYRIRSEIRQRFNRRLGDLRDVVAQGTRDADALVRGNLQRQKLNRREIEILSGKIAKLEEGLIELRNRAAELGVTKRGDFDIIHAELLNNISVLRAALANGTADLNEIRLGLQATYQTMYPHIKKVPDDIDVLADRIMAAKGVPASREVREINQRLVQLRGQLEALSPSSEEYKAIAAEVDRLKDLDNGYRVAAEYRATQDYAPDNGFLFITGREMAETDEMQIPFKLLRTNAAGFPDQADVMGVRVFGNDEVIDHRSSSGVARIFGQFDFGDGLVDQLGMLGLDTDPLQTGLDMVRVGLPIDPEWETAFPELADIVKLMESNQAREIMPYGDPQLVKAIYEDFVDNVTGLLIRTGVDNADNVARQVVDGALGYVADVAVETNSARGLMLPAVLFDDAAELDDIVVVLAPRVALTASDSVTAAVQDASSPLIQSIIRTDIDTAAGAARGRLNEVRSRQEEIMQVSTDLKQEIASLSRRKGGLKAAATKRRNAAAAAKERAGQIKNAPREIEIDGKVEKLTLPQINKRFESLTATEARFRANMEATLAREQASLRENGLTAAQTEAKLMANVDRLRVLFDEANALLSWDAGTGNVIRDEIAAAAELLASMPARDVAADAARAWVAQVQRTVESTNIIANPSVRTAYERLTKLIAFDEWNLAIADESYDFAKGTLDAIDSGKFGAILDSAERQLLAGWDEIAGLGVQVPEELLKVWKPNIQRLFKMKPEERNALVNGLDWVNKIFKTYAIGTVGFVVRNLYSAVFMNAVAGVDPKTMQEAWKAMWYYNKYGAGRWLDELGVVGAERAAYEQAMIAVESAGRRGMFTELATPVMRGTKTERFLNGALNNPYTNTIRKANSFTEDVVRFPLALKAIRNGDDYVGAASQVVRYHFDYTDLSKVDEFMMQFVPFWIWTTRNIPNQMANQWMRPQVYSLYESLQENLQSDDTSVLYPSWMQNYQPLFFTRLGVDPRIMLRPDLPHQRMDQSIQQFTNWQKFVGNLYPIYKLPFELPADKSFALDIPFKEDPMEAKGFDLALATALNAIGLEGAAPKVRTAEGGMEQRISEKTSYVLGQFLPAIATLQRLTGGALGGKASYQDRQLAAIATFFGLPLDYVTARMEGSEAIGRQFAISDYMDMLKRLGYLEPAQETKKRLSEPAKAAEAARKEQIADLEYKVKEAKNKYGTKSDEYKNLKSQLDAIRSPKSRQQKLDEQNIIALYGEDSPQHRRFLEELNMIRSGD